MSLADLAQSLDAEQLQDVAQWLRESATDYQTTGQEREATCLRSQATQLETLLLEVYGQGSPHAPQADANLSPKTLAQIDQKYRQKYRQTQPDQRIRGWLQAQDDSALAYLLMGDGSTFRQSLTASDSLPGDAQAKSIQAKNDSHTDTDPEPVPCSAQEMERAYRSGRFSILAGADYLADFFAR